MSTKDCGPWPFNEPFRSKLISDLEAMARPRPQTQPGKPTPSLNPYQVKKMAQQPPTKAQLVYLKNLGGNPAAATSRLVASQMIDELEKNK